MLIKINFSEKNYTWKSDEIRCPLPEKVSEYARDIKTFSKGLSFLVQTFFI